MESSESSGTKHTTTSCDGTEIGWTTFGSSGSPVLIVHGSIATGAQWFPVAKLLAVTHAVHVMDRRGRGVSGDAEDHSLSTEAADIRAVLDLLEERAVLVGHSYGAICALEAVRAGADVQSLVVYEPPLPVYGPTAGPALADYAAAIESGDGDAAMRIAAEHFLRLTAEDTEQFAQSPLWPEAVRLAPTWTRELRAIDATEPLIPAYAALPVRTLLLRGAQSPEHLVQDAQYLAARLPDATTVTFPGQGHFAHVMDPETVAAAVRTFMGA